MAAVTGSLVVELGLNTAKLVTGMKKAERRISDFSKRAKVMAKRIAKIGAVAVTAAAVGIAALAKSVANAGDKFQKMSISLGVSTEALSSLKHAAELSGASMQDIEKALKTVAKRANDAQAGLSTAVRSFEQLGISIEDSEGNLKSLDILLVESANAFAKMTDDTKAAALAQELFGKSGVNLLPLLKQGSEGIRKMQEEAKLLGITFDKEAADQAALFNDELLRLQRTLSGIKTQIGQALLPVMTELITELKNIGIEVVAWVKANKELLTQDVKGFVQGIVDVIRGGAERTRAFVSSIKAIKQRFIDLAGSQTVLETLRKQLEEVEKEIIFWGKALDNPIFATSAEAIKFMREQVQGAASRWVVLNETISKMRPILTITKDTIKNTNEEIKKLSNNINIFGQKGDESFRKVTNAVVEFSAKSGATWKKFFSEGSFAIRTINRMLENQIFDFFKTGSINMRNLWQNMLDAMLRELSAWIASSVVKTFLGIITGGIVGGGGGLWNFVKGLFGFQQGTAFVSQTGPAIVHQGERILSATQNKDLLRIIKELSGHMTEIDSALMSLGPTVIVPADKFTDIFGDLVDVARSMWGSVRQFSADVIDFRNDLIASVRGRGGDVFPSLGTFTGTEPGFIGPAINPNQIIINVEGSIITEQDLVQTVKDGIDIMNEDVFDASKFGEFAGVT